MKVALVYLGRFGGGNFYAVKVARALRRNRVNFRAFLSNGMENLGMFEGCDTESFDTFRKGPLDFIFFFPRLLNIVSAINKYDPDVLYSSMFNPYVFFLHVIFRKKKIYTLHGLYSSNSLTDRIIDMFQRIAVNSSDLIVVLSEHYLRVVQKEHRKPAVLIPLPLFDFFVPLAKDKFRKFGDYLLFTGRVSEKYKGFAVLEKAYAMSKKRMKLVVAGRGAKSDGKAGIIGIDRWLSDADFASLFRSASAVCVPYIQPTPSAVVATALSFGKPVIASDVAGLNEQVIDGKTGMLFQLGSETELAKAIDRMSDEKERKRLARATAAFAREIEQSFEKGMKKLAGLF